MLDKYEYTKERREFGRQCLFGDHDEQLFNLPPDNTIYSEYIRRDPVEFETQLRASQSGNEVATEDLAFTSRGMLHIEGGWPKDLNPHDEEQTVRYRRRIERDDQFDIQMKRSFVPMEQAIAQNNAVNVYERYFDKEVPAPAMKNMSLEVVNRFVDPTEEKRRVAHVNFSSNLKDMVVSYTSTHYLQRNIGFKASFIWKIDYSQSPLVTLETESCLMCLEFNPKDEFLLAGGMANGCVCLYDVREAGKTSQESVIERSHYDEVTSLEWIHSKQNTEFFTCSRDGQVMWWDTRDLYQPVEAVHCGTGCTVLEYHHTMPTKFLVGTDDGLMCYGNRRGKTPEEKVGIRARCYHSSILSIERNPVADKNIMTAGGHEVKIWSEECRDDYILATGTQPTQVTCAAWNPKRGSVLLVGHEDGTLRVWDLLMDLQNPIKSIRPQNAAISAIKCHPDGNLIACCHANGDVFLLQLSNDLSTIARHDRASVGKLFDRNLNQQKFFLAKLREIKLNLNKAEQGSQSGDDDESVEEVFDKDKAIGEIEQEFADLTK